MKFRKRHSVAILGCGPAGLFAAHALVTRGWDVVLFSRKRRSEMFGAQYLHRAIPGLVDPSRGRTIHYIMEGSLATYREKVYGRRSGVQISPELLEGTHSAWDIREAYGNAWDMYADLVQNTGELTPGWVTSLVESRDYKCVISTIPAPVLCERPDEHSFDSQQIWAIGDAPERGIFCPVTEAKSFQVICNGSRDTGWYRNANVFGYRTAEWGVDRRPPFEGVAAVEKPLSTNCTCLPEVVRLGRYGEWRKGALSHEAYDKACVL